MLKKNIFYKNKKKYITFYFFLFIIIFLLTLFIFFKNKSKYELFVIPLFQKEFYIIPVDKGGTQIMNKDKKVLHLNNSKKLLHNYNDKMLEYSVQLFSSDDYNQLNKEMDFIIKNYYETSNSHKKFMNKTDFFIIILNHNLGKEFLLLYKNFISRDLAYNYCTKYLKFLPKCLIVNVQNVD